MAAFHTFALRLGAGLALYLTYKLFDTVWLYARPSRLHRYLYTDTSGRRAWALITGSSDGIGKSLAFELAAQGFNIVLHGRNPAKLEAVRNELQATYPDVESQTLVADASQCHRVEVVDFERIRADLANLHLTILINCAGSGPDPAFGGLETYGTDKILDNLHLNAAFPTLLTAALLPVMRGQYTRDNKKSNQHPSNGNATRTQPQQQQNKKAKPVLILNIGSVTDDGFPLVSFYSAGKAASHALHKALAREAALDGWDDEVEIVSHRIGAATGVSHNREPPTLFRPDARTIARAVLARAGCGRRSVVPYWPHALQQAFLGVVPSRLVDHVLNTAMRDLRRIQNEEARKE
jgi:17beta-estradiol 17-dehydrogenase / very-long-chain 3-oxoacyl-CoA reductase